MAGLPGLPPPGFSEQQDIPSSTARGLPGLPPPGFSGEIRSGVPSIFDNPIDALTSSDWWFTRPSGETISAKQAVTGPLLSALSSLAPGLGDEIVAGGNSAIDSIVGNPTTYDQRLAESRDAQKNTPIAAQLLTGVPAVLKLPIASAVGERSSLLGKLGQSAKEGAALGGLYGLGSGEGGLSNRLNSAAEGAALGGAISPAITLGTEGINGILSTAEKIGPDLRRKALGARQGDYAKSANDLGIIDIPEEEIATRTKTALDDLINSGQLGESRSPGDLLRTANAKEKDLMQKIGGKISAIDQARTKAGAPGVMPEFENAISYLDSGKVPGDQIENYAQRLGKISDAIDAQGRGKLSFIQQQKVAIGKNYDPNDGVLNGFNRALYQDLQKTIESHVPGIAELNQDLTKWKIAKPIFQRGLTQAEAKDWVDTGKAFLRTSGGYGVPMIIGNAAGGPAGALAGAGIGMGVQRAMSPAGKETIGRALQKIGSSRAGGASLPAVAALGSLSRPGALLDKNQQTSPKVRVGSSKNQLQATPPRQFQESEASPTSLEKGINGLDSTIGGESKANAKFSLSKLPEAIQSLHPFIRAVIKAESNGNPLAKSKKGAQGLMQIMPAVAKHYGIDPTDPVDNIRVGIKEYESHINKYDDVRLAMAAYNWGQGNLDKLIKRIDSRRFENIYPYLPRETKDYIAKIEKNYRSIAEA